MQALPLAEKDLNVAYTIENETKGWFIFPLYSKSKLNGLNTNIS